jgi:hypothetical protein
VFFDEDSRKVEDKFAEFCRHYRSSFYLGDLIAGHGFASSRQFTPLQAADLLAYGTHHLAQLDFMPQSYAGSDFDILPAFWNMLLALAGSAATSPNRELIALDGLQELVRMVKNGEMLPTKPPSVLQS